MTKLVPVVGAAALGVCLLVGPAPAAAQSRAAAAQSRAADPWTRVPAFPKACYAGADDFGNRVAGAIEVVEGDRSRQKELNSALSARLTAMDPMELAQRMQAYMMKNPTEAAQAMQALQAAGTNGNAVREQSGGDYYKGAEFNELESGFKAALARALDPIRAGIEQHVRTRSRSSADGFTFSFATAVDEARYLALVSQQNTDYERLCATWLVGGGTIPAWMRNHKTYLVTDVVPAMEAADRAAATQIRIILGTQPGEHRSTETLDAVHGYLQKASRLSQLRLHERVVPSSGFVKRSP